MKCISYIDDKTDKIMHVNQEIQTIILERKRRANLNNANKLCHSSNKSETAITNRDNNYLQKYDNLGVAIKSNKKIIRRSTVQEFKNISVRPSILI